MTKCKFCNECKRPITIMGPICKYCNECKKPTSIMGPICGYYNECKKPTTIMGPICKYCNECIKNIYHGTYMWVLHIWKWPYGIYNRKWYKYYMFKMCVLF